MRNLVTVACLAVVTGSAVSALGPRPQEHPKRPDSGEGEVEVMVLGTYHFAGSDRDLVNVDVDSVLTERRQAELRAVASGLAEFEPTAVVTERVSSAPDYLDPVYADFEPSWLAARANERVQLAYRVSHLLGIDRVYGLDEQSSAGEPDYFPFDALAKHVEATGQAESFASLVGDFRSRAEEEAAKATQGSIARALLDVNTGFLSQPDFYYQLAQFDQGEAQPAAELQAFWFMRNAKIFSKLVDVAKPGDRVLIVFGAGHKYWLEHLVRHTPGFKLVKPDSYLQRAAQGR